MLLQHLEDGNQRSVSPSSGGTLRKDECKDRGKRSRSDSSIWSRGLQYWDLLAYNYFHSKHFPEALYAPLADLSDIHRFAIDCAIKVSPSSNMKVLGKLFHRRGRIFQVQPEKLHTVFADVRIFRSYCNMVEM